MQHRELQPIIVCSSDDPGLTLAYFTARSKMRLRLFYREKVKTVFFSETIAVPDLKVGRCRQLVAVIKLCEYSRSRSFLDHGPRLFTYEN